MPRVPQYEPQVTPAPLNLPAQSSVATPALLGGASDSAARFAQGVSAAGTGLTAIAYDMQERENADMVFQREAALKAEYLDYEASVRETKKGAFAKGVTNETKQWWDEKGKAHVESLSNERQRQLFTKRMTGLRLQSLHNVSNFEAQQVEIAHDQSWTANKVGSIDLAAAHANEETTNAQTKEIKRLNSYQAARKGWTPEVLARVNSEDITQLHQQVIQTLAKSSPAAAKSYFDKYKEEIRGSQRAEIGEFAEKATSEALGIAAAGKVWATHGPLNDQAASSLDKMEDMIRDEFKNDVPTQKAAISSLRERHQAFTTGRRERADKLESTVNAAVLKGASVTQVRQMPEFLQMPPEKARAIVSFMENQEYSRIVREDAATTRAERELRRQGLDSALRLSDPDELVKLTRDQVVNMLPTLGMELTSQLVNKHDALTKSAEALNAARLDNNTFKSLAINAGLNPNEKNMNEADKDRLVQLRAAVDARLSLEARAKGKPLSPEEKIKFSQQAFDDKVRVPGFWSAFTYGTGEDLPASSLTADERKKAIVILPGGERVRIRDIPPAFVDEAEAALRKAGRTLSQKSVAEMWQLNKDTWGKPKPVAPAPASRVDQVPY